jgi:tetratricopeptide (TPR) repeat protein
MKPGRNDPCPCGSGKKYKKCCESKHLEATAARSADQRIEPQQRAAVPQSGTLTTSESARVAAMVQGGRYSELESFARQLIGRSARSGIAWKLLAFALARQGKDSLEASRNAATLLPDDAEAQCNLGNALRALGQSAEALESYRRAIHVAPKYAAAYNDLGSALVDLGRLDEGMASYRRAIETKADLAIAHANLGNVLRSLGNYAEAIECYRRVLAIQPGSAEAHTRIGDASVELGQPHEALVHYQLALEIRPDSLAALTNIGMVLRELGQIDAAEASYRRVLVLRPDQAELHLNLATILHLQGRNTEAEGCCAKALEIEPQLVAAIVFLAKLEVAKGQFARAEQLLGQAISIDPKSPEAWAAIPSLRKMRFDDAHWFTEAQQIADQRLAPRKEMHLRYAMGKYCDDTGNFAAAFDNFHRANELSKQLKPEHDRDELVRFVAAITRTFATTWSSRTRPNANMSSRPVFIIGMPRSGTTLAEQILASHPNVFGAGELTYWDRALRRFETLPAEAAEEEAIVALAGDYLQLLERLCAGAARVVDKMPANFLCIGLIRAALPNARVIHMRRNPIDTCLSIYFQDFESAYSYANDLDNLAHYYAQYLRIMRHWRSVLPAGAILDIPYEGLVAEQEKWSRTMLEFIGLPWDPGCMDFHLTHRTVNTVSNWQVRQKITRSSIERWRNYEAYVEPLRGLLKQGD